MIDGLVAGKILGDPEGRKDKSGKLFAVAKVLAQTGEGETVIVNVISFDDEACAALLQLQEGDSLAVAGSLTPKVWTDKQGYTKPALDMVAQRVLSMQQG